MIARLRRAIDDVANLSEAQQIEVAHWLTTEVLPRLRREARRGDEQLNEADLREALLDLVGLIDQPFDVDAYIEECRGPAWDPEIDGEGNPTT